MPSSLRSRSRRTATAGPSRTLSTTPSARAMDLQLSRCSFQRCAIQLHLSPAAASPRVQIDANHVQLRGPAATVHALCFSSLLLGKDFGVALAVRIEARLVALRPGCLQLRLAEVPVGPAALQDGAQVVAQLFDGGPAEEPVAHVDLVDAQARLEHERVRDHRVVVRVGVLGDVEVLLHLATWIGKEGPVRADAGAELVRLGQAVSADGHQPAVPDLHLAMKLQEPFHLQPVLGTEAAAAEYQHQRVGPLQLGELAALAAVIGRSWSGNVAPGTMSGRMVLAYAVSPPNAMPEGKDGQAPFSIQSVSYFSPDTCAISESTGR